MMISRVPRMSFADGLLSAQALAAQIETRLLATSVPETVSAEDYNAVVRVLNPIKAELVALGTSAVPARLEIAAASAIATYDFLIREGRLPPDFRSGPSSSAPASGNGMLLIGAVGLGFLGLIWWGSKRQDAILNGALEDGEMEDCGCDG